MEKENCLLQPDALNSNEIGDLQKSFLMFKRKRQAALEKQPTHTRNPEEIKELRSTFLQQVKKYLGVPYHRRHHGPESPHYNAPLYLDCCGLVRKVCHDLKSELGFVLGPWNQGYQFDTLPIQYLTPKHMEPGDLVFISGNYIKPHSKKQVHDMVHVEVWLGDGDKTIGARWKKSVVEVHDSYKFVSTSYTDMKYYFCSIDTWLQGICHSFCPEHQWKKKKKISSSKRFCKEHPWKRRQQNFSAGKYSIFNDEEDDEGPGTPDQSKSQIGGGIQQQSELRRSSRQNNRNKDPSFKKTESKTKDEKTSNMELASSVSDVQHQEGSEVSILFDTDSSLASNRKLSSQSGTHRTCLTPSVVDICPFKDLTSATTPRKTPHLTTIRKLGTGSIGNVPSILRYDQQPGKTRESRLPGFDTTARRAQTVARSHYISVVPQQNPAMQQHVSTQPVSAVQQKQNISPRLQTPTEITTTSPMRPPKCTIKEPTKVIRYSVLKSNGTKSTTEEKDVSSDSFISLWHSLGTWNRTLSVPHRLGREKNLGYIRWQNKSCRSLEKAHPTNGNRASNSYTSRIQFRA